MTDPVGHAEHERIEAFLAGDRYVVAGASTDRAKYGNKVLRVYMQNGRAVHPINPAAAAVEGLEAFGDLASVVKAMGPVHGVSIVTPPAVTERVVDEAIHLGIGHLWMQPGAEHSGAIERAEASGVNVIAGGPCALVVLGYSESA